MEGTFPPPGPRFAPPWRNEAAEGAARVVFDSSPARSLREPALTAFAPATPSLAELRHQVALKSGQLDRAIEEVEILTRELARARTHGLRAEKAIARERMLRGKQGAAAAQKLHEHERTIAELKTRLERALATPPAVTEPATLAEVPSVARSELHARVTEVVAGGRATIRVVRQELASRDRRAAALKAQLGEERAARREAEQRLAQLEHAGGSTPSRAERASLPAGWEGIDTACRLLEQELAARHVLEARAARLIGQLHRELGPRG